MCSLTKQCGDIMKTDARLACLALLCMFPAARVSPQPRVDYTVSFGNRVHHEAEVTAKFSGLSQDPLRVLMSHSSPGRYALHEFAKNVYSVKAYDGRGDSLAITKP